MRYVTAKHLLAGTWLEDHCLAISDGQIKSIIHRDHLPDDAKLIDYGDTYLAPGLFDIQVNGGGDILINDTPTAEAIDHVATAHRQLGVTSLLPTLITDSHDKMLQFARAIESLIAGGHPNVVGAHFEGPFINETRKGVHDPKHIREEETAFLDLLDAHNLGAVLVTLAPEMVSREFLQALSSRGVVISSGHTNADYETHLKAIDLGLTGFTHLFNAMPPFLSREPGPIGAAFEAQNCYSGIIADGHHIHPATLKAALKALTPARAMLVSDAMPPVGGQGSSFKLGDLEISMENGRCLTVYGTLAGAAISLQDAVLYCVQQLELPLKDALVMASQTPATFMKLDKKIGRFHPGSSADFIVLSETGQITHISPAARVRA